jgi:hypothetical protein
VVLAIAQQDVRESAGAHDLLVAGQRCALGGESAAWAVGASRPARPGQGGQQEHVHGGQGVAIRTGSGPTMPPRMQMRICRKQG